MNLGSPSCAGVSTFENLLLAPGKIVQLHSSLCTAHISDVIKASVYKTGVSNKGSVCLKKLVTHFKRRSAQPERESESPFIRPVFYCPLAC